MTASQSDSQLSTADAATPLTPRDGAGVGVPPFRLRITLTVAFLVLAPLVAWQSHGVYERFLLGELHTRSGHILNLYVEGLQGTLDRYRPIPKLLAINPLVRGLLQRPDDDDLRQQVNDLLEIDNLVLNAADSYLMAADGTTLAASNWNQPLTFVGKNFAYRPYFQEAMAGRLGRFFALGTASGKRGYYFASPVYQNDRIAGATVVKVDIEVVEETWGDERHEVVVTDSHGIVFMSSRPEWLFRTTRPLTPEDLEALDREKRYSKTELLPFPGEISDGPVTGSRFVRLPVWEGSAAADEGAVRSLAMVSRFVPDSQWTVHVLADIGTIQPQAAFAAALVVLALAAAMVIAVAVTERRRAMTDKLALEARTRAALERSAAELERRVEERTADLKRTEEELIQAAKLAALGQMSASMSHEMNQPLAAIRSYTGNAIKYLQREQVAEAGDNLRLIVDLTDRMVETIRLLKSFARKGAGEVGPVDLAAVLGDTLKVMGSRIGREGVELDYEPATEPIPVAGNAVRIQQVLLNIVANALDAMRGQVDKRLRIAVEGGEQEIAIRIDDCGPGVAEKHIERVFEPFFTTKASGEGLGLGLSIASRILSDYGGHISVENRAQGGARFTVRLRRLAAAAEAAQ